jgi:8-oxo-dGTP pyrophosphatase MutT (NUDIX family)
MSTDLLDCPTVRLRYHGWPMAAQRKVTAFVTRGAGEAAELLVFWHTASGIQVPAGTVEEGESFEEAACREALEETALADLRLLRRLGVRSYDLPEGVVALRQAEFLRTRPGPDAPATAWAIRTGRIVDREAGFARLVYEETDLISGDGLVFARFEGWVPESSLLYRQEREFYHFHADRPAPERWEVIENGVHEFHLYWVPLVPKPALLIGDQQAWLDEFYEDLITGVEEAGELAP